MRRTLILLGALLASIALAAPAEAATKARNLHLDRGRDTRTMVVSPSSYAAFAVTLRVRHGRNVELRLHDASGAFDVLLMQTAHTACTRDGAWDVCSAAYEALPAGTYRFTVHKNRGSATVARLRVSW